MNQPVVLKRSLAIAAVASLQTVLPPTLVVGLLWLISQLARVPFNQYYIALAALAALLTLGVLRAPRDRGLTVHVSRLQLATDVLLRWALILGLLLGLGFAAKFSQEYARSVVIPWAVLTPPLLYGLMRMLQGLMRRVVLSRENLRSAVIVGANEASLSLASRLADHPELCTRVEGFFDDRSAERLGDLGEFQLLGGLSQLADHVRARNIDVIFIALPIRHVQRVMALLDDLRDSTASIYYVPDVFVFDLIQSRTGEIMGIPVVAMCETPFYGYRGVLKRLTDMALTLCIMVPAIPLMLLIALAIRLTSRGPVIFRQRRYGLDGREIVVYKFRSMYVTEDGGQIRQASRDDDRITPLGRLLRRYSLDELPQLINVLQGKMSLVGPRPHAVAHNEIYRRLIKGYMIRHKVLPGITGLAQVNGCRGETTDLSEMQNRVDYDLDYLRRWSPIMDIKILLLTAVRVLGDSKAY
ncbi:MAG: undecaprenyl-phosphate glucose phosphotransferase [Gammaproteobacteria bacterium]|nr:undecaprenyl-phosphate glucose phosphotransferase [Gammaproteobacteria bacterium]